MTRDYNWSAPFIGALKNIVFTSGNFDSMEVLSYFGNFDALVNWSFLLWKKEIERKVLERFDPDDLNYHKQVVGYFKMSICNRLLNELQREPTKRFAHISTIETEEGHVDIFDIFNFDNRIDSRGCDPADLADFELVVKKYFYELQELLMAEIDFNSIGIRIQGVPELTIILQQHLKGVEYVRNGTWTTKPQKGYCYVPFCSLKVGDVAKLLFKKGSRHKDGEYEIASTSFCEEDVMALISQDETMYSNSIERKLLEMFGG